MENVAESQLERILLVIRRSRRLAAAPTTIVKLLSEVDRGDSSAIELERIIISDPMLAAEFMSLGASLGWSEFGTEASIRSLVMRMGFRSIRSLAVSLMAKRAIIVEGNDAFDQLQYRKFSFATAVLTRYLTARNQRKDGSKDTWTADELFAVGLVSNLGIALLAAHVPDAYDRAKFLAQRRGITIADAFELIYGAPLSTLSTVVLEAWKLPPIYQVVIPNLNSPWKAGAFADAAINVAASQKFAGALGYQIEDWPCECSMPSEFLDDVVLSEAELETLRMHIVDAMAVYFGEAKAA